VIARLARGVAALVVSVALAELLVRAVVRTDADGGASLFGRPLPPRPLPVETTRRNLDAFLASPRTFLAWDAGTGWAPRPGATSADGLYRANSSGLRADRETPEDPAPGVLRVATFGDSFTFGDESPLDETWGARLEAGLVARGVPAEVLNFGVNGYGLDQAWLRWQDRGRRFRPDVVVLGLQSENALRDLNVFRPLFFAHTETPLTKPRFVASGEDLRVVNRPTLAPERIVDALATVREGPFAEVEAFLVAYPRPWWRHSRLASLVAAVVLPEPMPDLASVGSGREAVDLASRIVRGFAADARAAGAGFVVADLPMRPVLEMRLVAGDAWDDEIVAAARTVAPVVGLGPAVSPLSDGDFRPRFHWGARLQAAMAAALVEPVLAAACSESSRRDALPACAGLSRTASPGSRSRPAAAPPSPP